MFILDTNVVSELRKANKANPNVKRWNESVPQQNQFISAITLFELELGILQKERKDHEQGRLLRNWLITQVRPAFSGRCIALDESVLLRAALLHVPNPRPDRDSFIAATALVHSMTVVTRNVSDFVGMGIAILNPWD